MYIPINIGTIINIQRANSNIACTIIFMTGMNFVVQESNGANPTTLHRD